MREPSSIGIAMTAPSFLGERALNVSVNLGQDGFDNSADRSLH
jgi:hypothetical protein